MVQVFFANNYPMEHAREGVARGDYPRAHLWGADALAEDGIQVVFVPHEAKEWLAPIVRRLMWRFGDVGQELFVLGRARRRDAVYAADQLSLRGLSLLRGAHLFPAPIVTVVHHPIGLRRADRAFVKGIDVALCLSRRVQRRLIDEFDRPADTTRVVSWGPDLSAPFYSSTGERFVVSVGKTQRDIDTLLSAAATAAYPVRVYSRIPREPPGDHVEIVTPRPSDKKGLVDFMDVMNDLRDAAVVAIPLSNTDTIVGLTELNDALALGKPIVMTRSEYIDVDIEAIGCGIWVEPGDTAGWRDALDSLMKDPQRRKAMGLAGRRFAEREWNYDLFCQQVIQAVERVRAPVGKHVASAHFAWLLIGLTLGDYVS